MYLCNIYSTDTKWRTFFFPFDHVVHIKSIFFNFEPRKINIYSTTLYIIRIMAELVTNVFFCLLIQFQRLHTRELIKRPFDHAYLVIVQIKSVFIKTLTNILLL